MSQPEWIGDSSDALGIIRVSSHRQREGISHEAQEKEIREYADFNRLKLLDVTKLTESAKDSDDRKKFTAAMQRAVANGVRHILFYMYDREARNLIDTERNEKLVKAGLIVIHYVRERKVLHQHSSDTDFFVRDISAVTNKHYSRNLSTKINDAMRKKAEEGWYPSNRVPLGYALVRTKNDHGQELKRGTAFVVRNPDERRVKWVTMEFELRAQGVSYPKIRDQVAASGLLTPEEIQHYGHSAIEYRIKSPFYEGYFYWQGQRYKGKHELIIPPSLLLAARQSRGELKTLRSDAQHGVFGGGWMRCADPSCGCLITYDPKVRQYRSGKTVTFHYYRCANGKRVHTKRIYVAEDALWGQFSDLVEQVDLDPQTAKLIAGELNRTERSLAAASAQKIDGIRASLNALNEREDRAYEDMLARTLDPEAFRRQRDRIRSDRTRLSAELEAAKARVSGKSLETISSIFELAINAKSLFLSRSPREKREFLDLILSNPRLNGSTVEYHLRNPWRYIMRVRGVNKMVVPNVSLSDLIDELA